MDENSEPSIITRENNLSQQFERMEKLRLKFIHETIKFATEWYAKTAKEYVSKNAEHVLSMGNEQILRMKTQIRNLISNTENTVKQILEKPNLWWHLSPSAQSALNLYLQADTKYPIILDQAVRQILGRLGEILQEFKFHVSVRENYGSYNEYWYVVSPAGIVTCYPHLLQWTNAMQETISDYNDEYVRARAIFKEIELIKEQRKREEALSKWDSF